MVSILASIILGLCIFLGNISSQVKSYKIIEHISVEHSHHHHHDHKSQKKSSKSHEHHHAVELSSVTILLALPSFSGFVTEAPVSLSSASGFYSLEVLNQLSFSPPVFRPPIV